MSRELLPNRRQSEMVAFEHDGLLYTASTSCFADGRLAEIFIDAEKIGTAVAITVRDLAVAASLALQFGCPAETLRNALTRSPDGRAAGPLGALLDLVDEAGL
jgi:hypothetical protein